MIAPKHAGQAVALLRCQAGDHKPVQVGSSIGYGGASEWHERCKHCGTEWDCGQHKADRPVRRVTREADIPALLRKLEIK